MKKSERIMGWLGAGASVYLFFNVPEEACRAVLLPFVFLAFIWVLLEAASAQTASWAIEKAAQQNAHLTATPYCPHISENIDGTCPYCNLPKPPQVA